MMMPLLSLKFVRKTPVAPALFKPNFPRMSIHLFFIFWKIYLNIFRINPMSRIENFAGLFSCLGTLCKKAMPGTIG